MGDIRSSHETVAANGTSAYERLFGTFILGPSILITLFGTVTNLLSLSYFIKQRNFNNRQSSTEIINNHLFIALNVFDILVCVFLSAYVLVGINDYGSTVHSVCLGAFIVANQTTGFITCLLSVIRAISIIRPRHQLNVKVLVGTIIIYSIMMLYLNLKFFELFSFLNLYRTIHSSYL